MTVESSAAEMSGSGSPGAEFLNGIRDHLPHSALISRDTIDRASTSGGAYALLVHLEESVIFTRKQTAHTFAPGWYVYAGSAYGPGGIRARVRRHLQRDKPVRWHIDHLTRLGGSAYAVVLEHGAECCESACNVDPVRG